MNKTEKFLDLYKKLESAACSTYGFQNDGGAVSKLMRKPECKYIRAELDYIRDVRNLLTHRPKIGKDFAVYPTDAMINLLERVLEKVECPASAESIMIPLERVISCTKSDLILPTLTKMYERAFSHVPILDEGRVCGVFSDSTFIQCTISGEYKIGEATTFSEIYPVLLPEGHKSETFLFTERATPVSELSDLFEEYGKDGKKVGMIFVTKHGRPSEPLRGIITAWDMAAAF